MEGYSAKIESASKELTARERIMYKDTTDCIKLDTETQTNGSVLINVADYAILAIHNDKSENKDYHVFVLVDKDGQKYVTGSESLFSSFLNIYEELKDDSEDIIIKVYRMPSKNRTGKDFLTCSLV